MYKFELNEQEEKLASEWQVARYLKFNLTVICFVKVRHFFMDNG